jgi:hypothetical protein
MEMCASFNSIEYGAADGGDGLQIRRVAAKTMKQSRQADGMALQLGGWVGG